MPYKTGENISITFSCFVDKMTQFFFFWWLRCGDKSCILLWHNFLSTGRVTAVLWKRGVLVLQGILFGSAMEELCRSSGYVLFFCWIWVANLRLVLLRKLEFCKLKHILPTRFFSNDHSDEKFLCIRNYWEKNFLLIWYSGAFSSFCMNRVKLFLRHWC